MTHTLGTTDNFQLVLGGSARKDDLILPKYVVPLCISQVVNLFTMYHDGLEIVFSDFLDGFTPTLGYHGFGIAEH